MCYVNRMEASGTSLYIHVPFCRHRCGYCDFNTTAGMEGLIPQYVDALCAEIRQLSNQAGRPITAHTVYFGGGTPSLLPLGSITAILDEIRKDFNLLKKAEISLEANPGTISPAYLEGLHAAGVNRLSYGMQSANPEELRMLQRRHDIYDVFRAMEWSRKSGFDNISLDLIFGLPGQTFQRWEKTLETAASLKPDHFSLYSLTIEEGTPLHRWVTRGLVTAPDDDLAADMYELADEMLENPGFRQYEISNWAGTGRDGEIRACLHNLQYWRNLPYLGFGAGAHGCAEGVRTANVTGVREYIQRCHAQAKQAYPAGPATAVINRLSHEVEMQETMMVGLRLTEEGVRRDLFYKRFGKTLEEVFQRQISKLIRCGLLEWVGEKQDTLRLTKKGRLLGNLVFMEFVGEG